MQKILILGGSHRDIPLIKASQELGYYVITLGDREYYLGHNYSNKSIRINFNDLEKVREIVKEEKVDYLLPGCGEESYINTVKLSHEFKIGNFDELEVAKLIHNKWRFKKFCLDNGISTPKGNFYTKDMNLDKLNFPVVVKPTNLSGGRGVEIVNSKKELNRSLLEAKKVSDEIFLEEYIEGKLIAYSIFLVNQKIVYGFTGEDKTFLNKYLITDAFPYEIENEVLKKLISDIERLAKLLELVDGMFHFQVLIKNSLPYIIDVTRRIPGDLYPYLMEYCDGVDYCKNVVQAYTNKKDFFSFKKKDDSSFVMRHCVMPKRNGIFKRIIIDKLLEEKIVYKLDLMKENTKIDNYLSSQIAIMFIKLDKKDNNAIINNINSLIYPIID